jgi:hypothetical protein
MSPPEVSTLLSGLVQPCEGPCRDPGGKATMAAKGSRFKRSGIAGVVILITAIMGWGYINQAWAQNVDEAMQSFIQAMAQKNPDGIYTAFSRQSPWRYQPYEIGTGRPLKPSTVSPQRLAKDFHQKKDWYNFFLADPNGYTFRVNFIRDNNWKKRGADTFVAPDSDDGKTYITWRQEGDRWVIATIGETGP